MIAQAFHFYSITPNPLSTSLSWTPIIDDTYLTEQPYDYIMDKADESSLPPAVIGTTTDEGYLFVKRLEIASTMNAEEFYYSMLIYDFGYRYQSVIEEYNKVYGKPVDYIDRLSLISGDYIFLCPTRKLVARISQGQQKDIWSYLWDRGVTYNETDDFCYKRPCHGSELWFVFGTVSLWGQKFTSNDLNLSRQVQTYWKNMANKGNPNTLPNETQQFPKWPRYESGTGVQMFFNKPIGSVRYNYSHVICDFFDTIGYEQLDTLRSSFVAGSSLHLEV